MITSKHHGLTHIFVNKKSKQPTLPFRKQIPEEECNIQTWIVNRWEKPDTNLKFGQTKVTFGKFPLSEELMMC